MNKALTFRHVRTKNEKTQFYVSLDPEFDAWVKVRGRRQANRLPDVRDDCYLHYIQRSWKKFRKTQWKNNNKGII